ncbi:MAG: MFS transporter [Chthoniobacterales bacterium]|nr:MFS transporter [Chthoniobacterales bacterium]
MNSLTTLSEKQTRLIVWILLPLGSLNGMAVDLIAPSLPSIASSLHVSTSVAKNVITLYLLGYALGNFCSGFLTDALGRKHILRTGLLGFALVNLLPVMIPNITILLSARFFQGLAIGTIAVVIRAVFSDILPPQKMVRMGTLMGSMYGVGTVIGPLIGGYLQFYRGWQAGFLFFAATVFVAFIAVYFILPETHLHRHLLRFKTIQRHLLEVSHHRQFMGLVLMMGIVYSLMIAFNTVGPFLLQITFHHTSIFFGNIALCLGGTFLGATFVCRHFLKKYSVENLLGIIIPVFFLITMLSLVASFLWSSSMPLLLGVSAVMFFASGFIFPMCMGKGLLLFRPIAGTASAVMFLVNVLMTSATAFLLSLIKVQSCSAMIAIYVALWAASLLIYWRLIRDPIDGS